MSASEPPPPPAAPPQDETREALIEAATTAWRPRPHDGLGLHPSWWDLDAEGRKEVFEATVRARKLEAALDPEGNSTTVRAVLARLKT